MMLQPQLLVSVSVSAQYLYIEKSVGLRADRGLCSTFCIYGTAQRTPYFFNLLSTQDKGSLLGALLLSVN